MAAYNRKRAEQMSFTDDLMFRYVMRDPERCRMVLERVVGLKDIGHIEVLETQRSIMAEIDARGVRLDAAELRGAKGSDYYFLLYLSAVSQVRHVPL